MASGQWTPGDALAQQSQQQMSLQQSPQHLQMQPQHNKPIAQAPPAPSPAGPSHQDHLDRQLLRHLLNKYSREDFARMINEESQSPSSQNDAASVLTSSTFSSVKSEDTTSVFDSASSVRSLSDTSSRSSIISNVSARTAKFLSRKSHSNLNASIPASSNSLASRSQPSRIDEAVWDGEADANGAAGATKQKGAFMCGFCSEEGIQKTCTRKNDLKRHIEDFHNTNAQWFCRNRGCNMVFDWQTAYKTHLKLAHGGCRMNLDDAKVELCPQTVFACGFENCPQIFEAPTDADAPTTFKEYVGHVVKHFDEGANSGEWTYSTRMRNLLRQSGVLRFWTNSSWPEADRGQLQWQPQSSILMRKRLETRHIGDVQLLVQYAVALGSNPASISKYRDDFVTPILDTCQMVIHGHHLRVQPPPQMAPAVEAQIHQEADPFSFKISRNADPGLAAYLASQRRVYVSRPPVRSGRSARAPMHAAPPSSHGPGNMASQYAPYQAAPTANMFGGQQPQQHHQHHQIQHQQHQHPQQYHMMPQVNGGMVADDLRSLRTMASDGSEQDIEMGDTQLMDPSYMTPHQHQPDFSAAYGTAGMQGPGPVDGCANMSSPIGSVGVDQHHNFSPYSGPSQPY
jgi:hypothetical protein